MFSLFLTFLFLLACLRHSRAQSVTCDDSYECQDETIATTYAYCNGYYGCDNAAITASYAYLYGYAGGYQTNVTASYVYAHGNLGASSADIATYYLYAYGYLAARYANIESRGTSLRTYFYGYLAGYYADVSCYAGDTCYIYCGSAQGCSYTKFYCYSGATCHYDCSDDPSYCPTLYGGVGSALSDDEINAVYVQSQAMKKGAADAKANSKSHSTSHSKSHSKSTADYGIRDSGGRGLTAMPDDGSPPPPLPLSDGFVPPPSATSAKTALQKSKKTTQDTQDTQSSLSQSSRSHSNFHSRSRSHSHSGAPFWSPSLSVREYLLSGTIVGLSMMVLACHYSSSSRSRRTACKYSEFHYLAITTENDALLI